MDAVEPPLPISRSNVIIISTAPDTSSTPSTTQTDARYPAQLAESDLRQLLTDHDIRDAAADDAKPDRAVVTEETFLLLAEMRAEQIRSDGSQVSLVPVSHAHFIIISSGAGAKGIDSELQQRLAAHDERAKGLRDRIVVSERMFSRMEAARAEQLAEFRMTSTASEVLSEAKAKERANALAEANPRYADIPGCRWSAESASQNEISADEEESMPLTKGKTV